MLLTLTDMNGRKHHFAPTAIAQVSEVPPNAAWHGIRAFVRTFDGRTLEVQEDAKRIADDLTLAGCQTLIREIGRAYEAGVEAGRQALREKD